MFQPRNILNNLFLCILFISANISAAKDSTSTITIAQWNLENFYDAVDDPNHKGDDSYTPSKWTRWSESRYRLKLTNIADIVSSMKPDILCVEEVEHKGVLEDLCEVLKNVSNWPMEEIIHKDSKDQRGMDCAIISKFKPKNVKWINTGTGMRLSPCVEFLIDGKPLVVIGNHWKSRTGDSKISNAKREVNADKVRSEYQKRLAQNPGLALIVTGDFNDNCDDRIPMECGPFRLNMSDVMNDGISLFCLSALLPEEKRGTYFYSQAKTWNSFDTINISRGLLPVGEPASPWVADFNSYKVYIEPKMRMGEFGAPYPTRRVGTKKGHVIHYGYSDHFPVIVTLKARESKY